MKGLEHLAIVLAFIGLALSVIYKLAGFSYIVTATGVWRFTVVCIGFAIWLRLRDMSGLHLGSKPSE